MEALTSVVRRVCAACHSDALMVSFGNLSLQHFDVAEAPEPGVVETAEKMIVKLRAGMMPPPGIPRPGGDTLAVLVETLEALIDEASAEDPNPGDRPFQRLNQIEYERSVKDLLDLDIDAGYYLPLDTKSANFDNIADVQMMSATLLGAYLNAAAEVSRFAVGDPNATPGTTTYTNSGYVSQWERFPGAPFGTRGGVSVVHNFPAYGDYVIKLALEHTTTGGFSGRTTQDEQIEISIDGERVALLEVDQWMSVADRNGVNQSSEPIFIRSGPHRVTAAFLKLHEGPVEDLLSPHDWSLADRKIGDGQYGVTSWAHIKDMAVYGPENPTGVSETPSRARIFTCRPTSAEDERPCARGIVTRLGTQAFRRPLTQQDEAALMSFYEEGASEGGFEYGVRTALQAILASPDFVFRIEEAPADVEPGEIYRLSPFDLASRLSFFLWGTPPDEELRELAASGRLYDGSVLEAQARRMLEDPRSEALATRFLHQWLQLDDIYKVHPDRLIYPDFHEQLADAMVRETHLLFDHLVREDESMLELYSADYTFVNERLADHYGFEGIVGDHFRQVDYPDESRKGIFGHGSVLTLTSVANRTSPVLRGKWVMTTVLGTPPPPPPPGVPDLEETDGTDHGRVLTTRERMEKHRSSAICAGCHKFMDPIGLSLDNFDVTGRWRIRENGIPLDTRGELYDGTPVSNPSELLEALLSRPIPLVRNFTKNLMAYALGRRVEAYDQPTVRGISREAERNAYRMSSFILGVIESDAFQMKRAVGVTAEETTGNER